MNDKLLNYFSKQFCCTENEVEQAIKGLVKAGYIKENPLSDRMENNYMPIIKKESKFDAYSF